MLITAYPLTWPPSKERTPNNKRSLASYRAGFVKVRDELLNELRLFGADGVAISSNIPLRKDGLPSANFKEPIDPGIAVYFRMRQQSYAICCDAWDKAKDNLRAIGEYVAALRMIRNCRVASVAAILASHAIEDYVLKREQAKSQKSATSKKRDTKRRQSPPKSSHSKQQQQTPRQQNTPLTWREVLGVARDADFATVRSAYYATAKVYHPDSGILPDSEKMQAVNIAFEKAKLEYGK